MADLAGLPNTFVGVNLAFLHIRDLYAPNVILAIHLSDWAVLQDVGASTDPNLNVPLLGLEAGDFLNKCGTAQVQQGISRYDLVFNDVTNNDAGYYKYVLLDGNAFWDRLNVNLPNFTRWETYVMAATNVTGKPVIIWQVPVGNQYFRTENNTNGHYQDNRAEYFFGHVQELINVKIPKLPPGMIPVTVVVNGKTTNAVMFQVK